MEAFLRRRVLNLGRLRKSLSPLSFRSGLRSHASSSTVFNPVRAEFARLISSIDRAVIAGAGKHMSAERGRIRDCRAKVDSFRTDRLSVLCASQFRFPCGRARRVFQPDALGSAVFVKVPFSDSIFRVVESISVPRNGKEDTQHPGRTGTISGPPPGAPIRCSMTYSPSIAYEAP